MRVLGIETSCDETAAALIEYSSPERGRILAHTLRSQVEEHRLYGGVVPELAARAHIKFLKPLILQTLEAAQMPLKAIDAIAVTGGPGLMGGLLVGLMEAKALAFALKKPFIAVNHLEGHALTATLTHGVSFPYLLLLLSGGHTQLILVKALGVYERLGTTLDDALGEAFDKTAKLLSLPYPGGPAVEQAASRGKQTRFSFPQPLAHSKDLNFSFSGLKTAIRNHVLKMGSLTAEDVADICASFQACVSGILCKKLPKAFDYFRRLYPDIERPPLVVAGGVAANKTLRHDLETLCNTHSFAFIAPPGPLCTDNAVMIAWAGALWLQTGKTSAFSFAARSRWPLDETIKPLIGTGRRGAKV